MNWEETIKELFKQKMDLRGALFETVVYPYLKKIFGELEFPAVFDFKVKGKPIYIEAKTSVGILSLEQLIFLFKTSGEYYLVTRGKLHLPGKHICTLKTPLGDAKLYKLYRAEIIRIYEKEIKKTIEREKNLRKRAGEILLRMK